MEERLLAVEAELRELRARVERVAVETRGVLGVQAEVIARNVALTPVRAATAPANVVTVRDGAEGVALLGNSSTYAMRAELKRVGAAWVTDAPARWLVPAAAWAECEPQWSTTFNVTFARGAN
jgi:hypothetical protein